TEGEVEEALGARRIPAKSTIAVPVPVQRIPLQTTGVATPVAVTATYERPTAVVGSTPEVVATQTLQETTGARMVTFDDTFGEATARTVADEVTHNVQLGDSAEQRVLRRRLRGGSFEEAA